jgi:PAS domain-containing protein
MESTARLGYGLHCGRTSSGGDREGVTVAQAEEHHLAEAAGQPLELILARNLVSLVSLAAVLVDVEGAIVFFNDAAAEFFGGLFEETGPVPLARWRAEIGPFDKAQRHLPTENLPVTRAFRDGRPGFGRFHVRSDSGLVHVEVVALPLVGSVGLHGALVVFWPLDKE